MTIEIRLPEGYVAIVDAVDADLAQDVWLLHHTRYKGRKKPPVAVYYIWDDLEQKQAAVFMHREILERIIGRALKPGEMCRHRDRDGLNNRRSNLFLSDVHRSGEYPVSSATPSSSNKSGFRGVYYDSSTNIWRMEISRKGKRYRRSGFKSSEEAYKCYCEMAEHFALHDSST